MKDTEYVLPTCTGSAMLFLWDPKKQDHIPWPEEAECGTHRVKFKRRNRNYGLEICEVYKNTCREVLLSSFATAFRLLKTRPFLIDSGLKVRTTPPRSSKTGKLLAMPKSELHFSMKGGYLDKVVTKGFYIRDSQYSNLGYMRDFGNSKLTYKLASSKSAQQQLFRMMDVALGSVVLRVGGPGNFFGHKNTHTFIGEPQSQQLTAVKPQYSAYGERARSEIKETRLATRAVTVLKYKGISNLWLSHPALFAIVWGQARAAIDAWCHGEYDLWNKELSISKTRSRLVAINKRQTMTIADRNFLMTVVHKIAHLIPEERQKGNVAYFPINQYTVGMFDKFLLSSKAWNCDIFEQWKAVMSSMATYSLSRYGFYSWCDTHKSKTEEYNKRKGLSMSGTVGTMVRT